MPILHDLFINVDFSTAELSACLLDGEMWPLDSAYILSDCPDSVALRARIVDERVDSRCVAVGWSAAWIHGAITGAPRQHTVALRDGLRLRFDPAQGYGIAQMSLESTDVMGPAGALVTTPLRTAIDLARFTASDKRLSRTLAQLMKTAGATLKDAERVLNRGRNLPYKLRAYRRLGQALAFTNTVNVVDGINAAHTVEKAIEVHCVTHLEYKATQGQTLV
jgi:hypothetical protein